MKTVSDIASHETAKSMELDGTFRVSFRLCSTLPPYALPLCTGICKEMTTVRIEEVHLCIVHATHQATQSAVRVDFQLLMCERHGGFDTTAGEFSLTGAYS